MLKVNILTKSNHDCFLRQLDKKRFSESEFYFAENSDEDLVWDIVVVYEGVIGDRKVIVKKGGLIFISGEPPLMVSYPNNFAKQFDWFITSHKDVKNKHLCLQQQCLDWHYGFCFSKNGYSIDYDGLKKMKIPKKILPISIITSNQKMMPGHNRRIILINKLKERFGNNINLFGRGYHFIDDKAEAIDPYYFHICIENSAVDHYWTEKLADSLLGYSVPIYIGAPNIEDYFDKKGMLIYNISDYDAICDSIQRIINNPAEEYQRYFDALKKNRELLLDVYNIFPSIYSFYKKNIIATEEVHEVIVHPAHQYISFKFRLYFIRFKRLIYKLFYEFKTFVR